MTAVATTDGRVKRRPLSPEQSALVAEQAEWVPKWVTLCVPRSILHRVGFDDAVSQAWVYIIRAAASWRPGNGSSFRTYAMAAVRNFLPLYLQRTVSGLAFNALWHPMPQLPDDDGPASALLPARSIAETVDPLLAFWCKPDVRAQRAILDWRARLVLYLLYVERWTLAECAAAFAISTERVRQLETRAILRLKSRRAGDNA